MIFALNFGLFNEFGEYLVTVGHSVAFLFPLLLKFGTAGDGHCALRRSPVSVIMFLLRFCALRTGLCTDCVGIPLQPG